MNTAKNQQIYYVPFVRLTENFKPFCNDELKKGAEYPIHDEVSHYQFNPEKEVEIMVHDFMWCNIIRIPKEKVKMIVKEIAPKFKRGDVVIASREGGRPWRVFEVALVQGKIWYRDGWCMATNCESGMHEENMRLATEDEKKSWEVEYNDDLVKRKAGHLAHFIDN